MEFWQALSATIVGLCIGLIAVAMARLPASRAARPLRAFIACGLLWALGDVVATEATVLSWKLLGLAVLYTGAIFMPSFWWITALRWAEDLGAGLPLRGRRWERAPLVFASAMWLVMITNPWHGQLLTPVIGGRNVYEPLWWCMAIPNYSLIVGVLLVELEVVRRLRVRVVGRQASFLIAASLVTLLGNLLYVAKLEPFNGTALVLSVSVALLLVGMFRDGLFGALPLALPALAAADPDGLVVARPDGRVAWVNDRARELLAPLGIGIASRIPDDLASPPLRAETPELRGEARSDFAWWQGLERSGGLYRLSGDVPRWLHLSARIVSGRRGRPKALCLRITDVTAERRAETALSRTQRLESLAALAGRSSQGFQNAFAVILGNADLMTADHAEDDSLQRKVTRVIEAAERGLDLTQHLQIYAGESDAMRVVLELSEVLEETCGLIEADLGDGSRLDLHLARELLLVEADAIQLRQALYHLLVNAIDALPEEGGDIHASTGCRWLDPAGCESLVAGREEAPDDYAYVCIADTGPGMDPDTQERIFDPFFTTKGKSRGVGLSTVLGIARSHGALLELETGPGLGSAFTLYFPRAPAAAGDG